MPSVWGGAGGTGSQGARESKLKARHVMTGGPTVPTDRMTSTGVEPGVSSLLFFLGRIAQRIPSFSLQPRDH